MAREPLHLFISYAPEDESLRAEFDEQLAQLRREGEIQSWHRREVGAGEEWRGQVDERLAAADLILLLLSPSFLASDYCYDDEANRALGRHARGEARVIPMVVRSCDWRPSPFGELQTLPKGGEAITAAPNRDQAWLEVVEGLRAAIAELRRQRGEDFLRHGEQQPQYPDDESRQLSRRLKGLFARRRELTLAGDDTVAVEAEILDVRRLLRQGPQLRAGEFLGDGRYELIKVVGQGGFATVWKAWDGDAQRLAALKVLHGQYSEDRGKRERFFRGARKMAELAHPHIVRVYETECSEDGWHFFVMEYVAGGNFEHVVLSGEMTMERRLEIIFQVGAALEHAHGRGAIHRDVKPSNILLCPNEGAKLSDFDLVRAADTTGLTATQAMLGTVQFAAPEALGSAGEAGPASDVYSLASTTVFALASGRLPPWYYRDPGRAIAELGCPKEQKQVLERATAFEAAERYASVSDFCQELQGAAALGVQASRLPRVAKPPDLTSEPESVPIPPSEAGKAAELAQDAEDPEPVELPQNSSPESAPTEAPWIQEGRVGEELADDRAPRRHSKRLRFLIAIAVVALASALWLPLSLERLASPSVDLARPPSRVISLSGEPAPVVASPGDLWIGPRGIRFRYAPAGKFQMGSSESEAIRDDDEVLHEVELTQGYWIGETEVTQGQWRELMGSTPAGFKHCGDACPVESVNWYEAVEFANRLSQVAKLQPCYVAEACGGTLGGGCGDGQSFCTGDYRCEAMILTDLKCEGFRLPTEAEWEHAARAGTKGPIYSGSLQILGEHNSPDLSEIAWYGGNSKVEYQGGYGCADWPEKQEAGQNCGTHRVRLKKQNAWQLYDLLGNVLEWTQDTAGWDGMKLVVKTDTYLAGIVNPVSSIGTGRVVRGGSWSSAASFCRVAARNWYTAGDRRHFIGFRLVKTVSAVSAGRTPLPLDQLQTSD